MAQDSKAVAPVPASPIEGRTLPSTPGTPAELMALPTPTALIDLDRLDRNIAAMQVRASRLGVTLRPHAKTSKSAAVVARQVAAGAGGITVSTMKEAEQFHAAGISDILYAVGIAPNRFERAAGLRDAGCDLKLVTDNLAMAAALGRFATGRGRRVPLLIEIDSDGHRSGVEPASALLLDLGRAIAADPGLELAGVLTHAGESYGLNEPAALRAMADRERDACVLAATRLREAGLPCPIVSVGATPTACVAEDLSGITEMRPGVYVFFDLVMANVGVCGLDDIALSVLTTVIGHQPAKGWAIVDAGWMAMSRDRGTADQAVDYGYGQVCDLDGRPIAGATLVGANQEHGIVSIAGSEPAAITGRLPVGTLVRVLPNHACATGAQHDHYQTVAGRVPGEVWSRFSGW